MNQTKLIQRGKSTVAKELPRRGHKATLAEKKIICGWRYRWTYDPKKQALIPQ